MERLISNGLEIVTPKLNSLTNEDIMLLNKSLLTLDSWSTPQIMKNLDIEADKMSGVFRSEYFSSEKGLYFIFEESEVTLEERELLGSFVTLPNIELQYADELDSYVEYCTNKHIQGINGYMTMQTALKLRENDNKSSCYINYMLTNPKYHRKKDDIAKTDGLKIGQRTIETLCKHPNFFSENGHPLKSYMAMIGIDNEASIGLFRKFGFETCPSSTNQEYDMFYKSL